MIKTILTSLMVGVFFTIDAQTISEIKSSSESIDGRMSNSFYKHDVAQFNKIRSVLKLDVFEYFDLSKQYDSDLKKKVFQESDEYSEKLAQLEKERSKLQQSTYFLDFEPKYCESYDLTSKTFTVNNEIYTDNLYKEPGYIQFDHIVFTTPTGITNERNQLQSRDGAFIRQSIKFEIDNESLALKIEENSSNLRLLFVFKFTEAIPFDGLNIFGNVTKLFALANTLEKVIIYNSDTGEVYHTYN